MMVNLPDEVVGRLLDLAGELSRGPRVEDREFGSELSGCLSGARKGFGFRVDPEDESTWPSRKAWTLNWNTGEWFVEPPGELRLMITDNPADYAGIRFIELPEMG